MPHDVQDLFGELPQVGTWWITKRTKERGFVWEVKQRKYCWVTLLREHPLPPITLRLDKFRKWWKPE